MSVRTFYNCPFEAELDVRIDTLTTLLELMAEPKQITFPEVAWRRMGHVYATLLRSVSTIKLAALCVDFASERTVKVTVTMAKEPPAPPDIPDTPEETARLEEIARISGITVAQAKREIPDLVVVLPGPGDPHVAASNSVNDVYARAHINQIAAVLGVPIVAAPPAKVTDPKPEGEKAPSTEKAGEVPAKE